MREHDRHLRTATTTGMLAWIGMVVVAAPACSARRSEATPGPWPPPGQWMGTASPEVGAGASDPVVAVDDAPSPAPDPRCPKDVTDSDGDLDIVHRAVAACVDRQIVEDRAAVTTLARAIGTRTGEATLVKCADGIPDLALIDARGRALLLTFCAQVGVREAHAGGLRTIVTADPPAVEAWLRERGVEVDQARRGLR